MDAHRFTGDPLLHSAGQQDPEGAVGIHHVVHVGDVHRDDLTVRLRDLPESGRPVEGPGLGLADREVQGSARRVQVHHRPEPVRAVLLAESTA